MCMVTSTNVLSLNKRSVLFSRLGLLLRLIGNHEVFCTHLQLSFGTGVLQLRLSSHIRSQK